MSEVQHNKSTSRLERRQFWWKNRKSADALATAESSPSHNHRQTSDQLQCQVSVSLSVASDVKKQHIKPKKTKQYVLFVGNLPFSATKDDIMQHFSSTGGLMDVRLLTSKGSGKSRGCAYVEFSSARAHKLGLQLHESLIGGRKINVEFTSPGRKTPMREQRLKEKNRKAARLKKAPAH